MADEVDDEQTGASTPERRQRGIFLPSMVWTTDRKEVEQGKQRLLALHEQLSQVVVGASGTDERATWYMMVEESPFQLDRDIDGLFEWLEGSERRARKDRYDEARN